MSRDKIFVIALERVLERPSPIPTLVNFIFKVSQGLLLAGTFNISMWSLLFVYWDIYLTSITKKSTLPMHRLYTCMSVDFES